MHTIALKPRRKLEELNMLPVMNLFSILIPFLISISTFQKMAVVEVDVPENSKTEDTAPTPAGSELQLSLVITQSSLQVWSNQGALPPIPFDQPAVLESEIEGGYVAFREQLSELHRRTADMLDGDKATVVAADDIVFDRVIQVMDAARLAGYGKIGLAKLQ